MNNSEVHDTEYNDLYKLIATNYDLSSLASNIKSTKYLDYKIFSLKRIAKNNNSGDI